MSYGEGKIADLSKSRVFALVTGRGIDATFRVTGFGSGSVLVFREPFTGFGSVRGSIGTRNRNPTAVKETRSVKHGSDTIGHCSSERGASV